MKAMWKKQSTLFDAKTLRERASVFGACAGLLVFLVHSLALAPLFARQASLAAQIRQQQASITGIDAEIVQKLSGFAADPDAVSRVRLEKLRQDAGETAAALRAMQKGLVSPDQIAGLLETILKKNGHLTLLSLKTVESGAIGDELLAAAQSDAAAAPDKESKPESKPETKPETKPALDAKAAGVIKPSQVLYRHGVEIVVQGSYPDMVAYMAALEAMPTQLFWRKAELVAGSYPRASLRLNVYTLSLDQKWMKL
jgi:MSHA biogenesis protein MshJ